MAVFSSSMSYNPLFGSCRSSCYGTANSIDVLRAHMTMIPEKDLIVVGPGNDGKADLPKGTCLSSELEAIRIGVSILMSVGTTGSAKLVTTEGPSWLFNL